MVSSAVQVVAVTAALGAVASSAKWEKAPGPQASRFTRGYTGKQF